MIYLIANIDLVFEIGIDKVKDTNDDINDTNKITIFKCLKREVYI